MQPLSSLAPLARHRPGFAALALTLSLLATAAPQPAKAQGLPDFTELVEKVGPAVVNIRTTERGRVARGPAGGGGEIDEDMLEFFRRFGLPMPNRPEPARPAAAGRRRAAAARRRLRLHPQRRRLRDDERPRRRGRRRGDRDAGRQARVQGQDHRRRQALRRRPGQDRGERPADGAHRRRRQAQGRRMGDRHRLAVRPREARSPPASSAPSRATPASSCL